MRFCNLLTRSYETMLMRPSQWPLVETITLMSLSSTRGIHFKNSLDQLKRNDDGHTTRMGQSSQK